MTRTDRRGFLAAVAGVIVHACRRVRKEWTSLRRVENFAEGRIVTEELTVLESGWLWDSESPARVFVTRRGGDFVALLGICTHKRCFVSFDEQMRAFRCPCHGSVYGADGRVLRGPAEKPLARLAVRVSGGVLEVKTG